jgi:hypothetical protein
MRWISEGQLEASAEKYGKSEYGKHLKRVMQGKILYGNAHEPRPRWGGEDEAPEEGQYDLM